MGYRNPADRAAQMRQFYARRRAARQCLECGQPAPKGVRCEVHQQAQRLRSRVWARKMGGHAPRYPDTLGYADHSYRFDGPKTYPYYGEDLSGQPCRVLVEWRDPLTLLLRLEEMGYDVFHSPFSVFAA